MAGQRLYWWVIDATGTRALPHDALRDLQTQFGFTHSDRHIVDLHMPFVSTLVFKTNCIIFRHDTVACIATDDTIFVSHTEAAAVHLDEFSLRMKSSTRACITNVADAIFNVEMSKISLLMEELHSQIYPLLTMLERHVRPNLLARLKSCKTFMGQLAASIAAFKTTITSCISALPAQTVEIANEELDVLFQSYYTRTCEYDNSLRALAASVATTEEVVNMKQSEQRNMILRLELFTMMVTMSLSIISAASGLMGMNLDNAQWVTNTSHIFAWFTFSTVSVAIVSLMCCAFYVVRAGII